MKKFIATALLPLLLMLGACGGANPDDAATDGVQNLQTTKGRIIVENDPDMIIEKVTIDGTTCVVLDGYQSVGLDCDWDNSEPSTDSEFE